MQAFGRRTTVLAGACLDAELMHFDAPGPRRRRKRAE
jgi:hypothetical protein